MSNIIPAHKTDDSAIVLTPENAPAVFGAPNPETMSKRYVHVPTNEFIPIAEEVGWQLFNTGKDGSAFGARRRNAPTLAKDPNAAQTAAHFVAFRPSDNWLESRGLVESLRFDGGVGRISRAIPRLVVYNSHDKTRALKAVMGIFDFICSNSAIMMSDSWGSWTFRHMNIDPTKILHNFFTSVIESACYVLDIRNAMHQIEVTQKQALEFADSVIDIRWDGSEWKIDPNDLVRCRHSGQEADTAYNVFQRVQEGVIRAGFEATRINGGTGKQKPNRKQSAIKDYTKDLNINTALYERATEWLNNMGKQLPPPPKVNINVK